MTARTVTGIARQSGWKPVAERDFGPQPHADGLDFVLTPQERDQAAMATLYIEQRRRELNRRDTAQAVADELVRRES